jgi:uncharacterized protein with PQ loop repeat
LVEGSQKTSCVLWGDRLALAIYVIYKYLVNIYNKHEEKKRKNNFFGSEFGESERK